MIKRLAIAIVLIVLICGGLVGFNLFRDKAIADFFASMPIPSQTISATQVMPVTWRPTIAAIGTAKAAQGVDVAVEASGVVRQILFAANEHIPAGQLLLQIDDAVERAEMIASTAAVQRDQAQLDRARSLTERGVAAAATLEDAQAALDVSRSALERISAVLERKRIEAPFAGTIGIPQIDLGAYVEPGDVIATLQDLETMKVDFTVPEQMVGRLQMGQNARFGAAEGDLTHEGTITGIEPKTDPATRLVLVRAEVDNTGEAFRPGQFVRVEVELPAEEGVIAVPQTAVTTSLYGDFVFTVAEEDLAGTPTLVARQVFVKTGRRSGGLVEIVQGLSAGTTVVTSGQNKLDSGTPVTIDNTVDPARLVGMAQG